MIQRERRERLVKTQRTALLLQEFVRQRKGFMSRMREEGKERKGGGGKKRENRKMPSAQRRNRWMGWAQAPWWLTGDGGCWLVVDAAQRAPWRPQAPKKGRRQRGKSVSGGTLRPPTTHRRKSARRNPFPPSPSPLLVRLLMMGLLFCLSEVGIGNEACPRTQGHASADWPDPWETTMSRWARSNKLGQWERRRPWKDGARAICNTGLRRSGGIPVDSPFLARVFGLPFFSAGVHPMSCSPPPSRLFHCPQWSAYSKSNSPSCEDTDG